MPTRQRLLIYGSVIGATSFLTGCVITYLILPEKILTEFSGWEPVVWVYLNAHFVTISGTQVQGLAGLFQSVDLIESYPGLEALRVVPVLLVIIGGLVMIEVMGYTRRVKYLVQNATSVAIGYAMTGLFGFIISGAQPGVGLIILIGVVVALAAMVGSTITNAITPNLEFFGIVSLGSVIMIGLLVILGGAVVIQAIWPLFAVSLVGGVFAAALSVIARSKRW
jgi:hypothetical protein